MSALMTVGYEGAGPSDFLDCLANERVTLVVDIRERTASRKPGFSKSSLGSALRERGIAYEHWRELGTPKEIRDRLRREHDWHGYRELYLRRLDALGPTLQRLAARIERERACLMCFERDALSCHRSLVASRLEQLGLAGAAVHLVVPKPGLP